MLGVDIGESEDEVFWTALLRILRDCGLSGVRLVVSDAHSGLKASIARVFAGATRQRPAERRLRPGNGALLIEA